MLINVRVKNKYVKLRDELVSKNKTVIPTPSCQGIDYLNLITYATHPSNK